MEENTGLRIQISYQSSKPLYEQIQESIRESILKGALPDHAALPSVRQLARDLNVSMITTKRAYAELEREGLLYTVSGKGSFVRGENLDEAARQRRKTLLAALENSLRACETGGVSLEAVLETVDRVYVRQENLGGNRNE